MGMSSTEWSRYMHDVIGLAETPEEINAEVVRRMQARYADELPLIDGAVDAVRRLAAAFRLGLASSSNRPLIELVLTATGLDALFEATVSSEEVERGKPAAGRLPRSGAAAGRRSRALRGGRGLGERDPRARAAGMRVVAIPNRRYPPPPDALALADRHGRLARRAERLRPWWPSRDAA